MKMNFRRPSSLQKQHTAKIPTSTLDNHLSVDLPSEQIPTFYVHGFRGGRHTTEKMIYSAQKALETPVFLRATVDWLGKIHYSGYWSNSRYPIVQLIFKDRWISSSTIERWFNQILSDLSQRYDFKKFNAVGHSLGAVALVSNCINSYNRPLPKINRLALVAAPFDGLVMFGDLPNLNPLNADGRPAFMTPKYLWTYLNRFKFPKHAHVLNIFGNIDDTSNTDQYVSVSSARSIKYILQNQIDDFQEFNAIGTNGEHSKLHDDERVLKTLNSFLYPELQTDKDK